MRTAAAPVMLVPHREEERRMVSERKPLALTMALGLLAVAVAVLAGRRRPRFAGGQGQGGPPPAGVREPRRPLQPTGAGSVAADLEGT